MKFRIVLLIGLGMLPSLLMAMPVPNGGMSSMQATGSVAKDSPPALLRNGIDKLLSFMRSDSAKDEKAVAAFLDKEIAPYFDFTYMTRWIIGPAYRQMSGAQRQAMEAQLKARFLGALARRLAGYEDQKVQFFRPNRNRVHRNEVKVSVGILRPGTYPSKIDFRFYRSKDGWKVFDVAANGSSALVHYRREFNRAYRMRRPGMWPVRY